MVELHIIEELEEKLLHRKKLVVVGKFDGPVPSRGEVLLEISKITGAKPEVIVLRSIRTHFGERKFTTIAYIYETPEFAKKVELKHYFERTKLPEPKEDANSEATSSEGQEGKEQSGKEASA